MSDANEALDGVEAAEADELAGEETLTPDEAAEPGHTEQRDLERRLAEEIEIEHFEGGIQG